MKQFAQAADLMKQAFADYKKEVMAGTFPEEKHSYKIEDEVIDKLY